MWNEPRFASESTIASFRLGARQYLKESLFLQIYPELKRIKVPVMWLKRNRFTAHIQITPEYMPVGRVSSLAIRNVTIAASGELSVVLKSNVVPIYVDKDGVLRTGEKP